MAVTIDGINLIITLETGVTDVDLFEDVYEDSKDWYKSTSNRKYPFPFVSDGANPLTAVLNQGGYIFLRNDLGWRIRPPEENITILLTGSLIPSDPTLPMLIPTIGNFTAGVFGIQPITQIASGAGTSAQDIWDHVIGDGITARQGLLKTMQALANNSTIVTQGDGSQVVTIFEDDGTTPAFTFTVTKDGKIRVAT